MTRSNLVLGRGIAVLYPVLLLGLLVRVSP